MDIHCQSCALETKLCWSLSLHIFWSELFFQKNLGEGFGGLWVFRGPGVLSQWLTAGSPALQLYVAAFPPSAPWPSGHSRHLCSFVQLPRPSGATRGVACTVGSELLPGGTRHPYHMLANEFCGSPGPKGAERKENQFL